MNKLYIAMVGLPARGKSTVADKLREGLADEGLNVKIFNNGELRRKYLGEASSRPEFYHPDNLEGRKARSHLAQMNIDLARDFLGADGDVAILDATNASAKRRATIMQTLQDHPVLFVECVNNDKELLDASILRKTNLPEFERLTKEQAIASFKERISYYEHIYSPLASEPCYIRVNSLYNRIIEENFSLKIPYYIRIRDILVSDWVRNLYLVRHGQTFYNVEQRIGGNSPLTEAGMTQAQALGDHFKDKNLPYIFTSTRRRSHQTAAPIFDNQPNATTIALSEFDEIDAGICENMRYEDIKREMPEEYSKRQRDKYNYIYPGGEGYITLKKRVDQGMKKALYLSGNAEAVMIVGHQAINRMILMHFLFRRTEDVPYIYIPQDQYFHITSTMRKKLFELVRFTGRPR